MGKNWIDIRLKTEPANMKYVKGRILGYPEEVLEKYYFQFLQYVAATGADVGRQYIGSAAVSTRTGQGEGRQGRVDSGTMQKNFKWSARKDGKKYIVDIGWINGTPGYSIFQEQGTKGGIVGMNAIGYVQEWVRSELKFYEGFRKGTKVRNSSSWNTGEE
jgi:hypothetical protein